LNLPGLERHQLPFGNFRFWFVSKVLIKCRSKLPVAAIEKSRLADSSARLHSTRPFLISSHFATVAAEPDGFFGKREEYQKIFT